MRKIWLAVVVGLLSGTNSFSHDVIQEKLDTLFKKSTEYLNAASNEASPNRLIRVKTAEFMNGANFIIRDSRSTQAQKIWAAGIKFGVLSFSTEYFRDYLWALNSSFKEYSELEESGSVAIADAKASYFYHWFRWHPRVSVDEYFRVMKQYIAENPKGFSGPYNVARFAHHVARMGNKNLATYILERVSKMYTDEAALKILRFTKTQISHLFAVPSLAGPQTKGDPISLADFKGKVVLLDFWATWCGPCRKLTPELKRLHNKFKFQGFEIVGVSTDLNAKSLTEYLLENSIAWPQIYFGDFKKTQATLEYFGVMYIPSMFLLDRQGRVVRTGLQPYELEAAIQKAL